MPFTTTSTTPFDARIDTDAPGDARIAAEDTGYTFVDSEGPGDASAQLLPPPERAPTRDGLVEFIR